MTERTPLPAPNALNDAFGTLSALNDAFGAPSAVNDAFGALSGGRRAPRQAGGGDD